MATDGNSKSSAIQQRRCHRWALIVLVLTASLGLADDTSDAEKSRNEILAKQRAEMLYQRVVGAKVKSTEAGFPTQFVDKPLFKYTDPARGIVAATVWRLGEKGRPLAIIAAELDRVNYGPPSLSYEFISLTKTPFSVDSDDIHWTPHGTTYEFKPIPKAPAPETTPQRRLIQMRELLKRFASREEEKNEPIELRPLSQPIDRYVPSKADRADGAIFLFAYGTNPEVMLMIESDGKQWMYAAGRMTGAKVVVLTFDDVTVWEGGPLQTGADAPFTGGLSRVTIPGIAADGSELKE